MQRNVIPRSETHSFCFVKVTRLVDHWDQCDVFEEL